MRRQLWWVLGLVLVAAGLAVVVATRQTSMDFGWFAYSPLQESADWTMSSPDLAQAWIVSPWQVVGAGVAVLGLLVVVARAAYLLGRRRA